MKKYLSRVFTTIVFIAGSLFFTNNSSLANPTKNQQHNYSLVKMEKTNKTEEAPKQGNGIKQWFNNVGKNVRRIFTRENESERIEREREEYKNAIYDVYKKIKSNVKKHFKPNETSENFQKRQDIIGDEIHEEMVKTGDKEDWETNKPYIEFEAKQYQNKGEGHCETLSYFTYSFLKKRKLSDFKLVVCYLLPRKDKKVVNHSVLILTNHNIFDGHRIIVDPRITSQALSLAQEIENHVKNNAWEKIRKLIYSNDNGNIDYIKEMYQELGPEKMASYILAEGGEFPKSFNKIIDEIGAAAFMWMPDSMLAIRRTYEKIAYDNGENADLHKKQNEREVIHMWN